MPSANLVVAKAQLQLSEPTKADVNDIFQSIFRLPKAQRSYREYMISQGGAFARFL